MISKEYIEVDGKRLEVEIRYYEELGLFEVCYGDICGVGTMFDIALNDFIRKLGEGGVDE